MHIKLDPDWHMTALRCPACGNRGRDGHCFWLRASIRVDGRCRAELAGPSPYPDQEVECSRCLHAAPLSEFEPPWFRPTEWAVPLEQGGGVGEPAPAPEPLTADDIGLEQAWLGEQLSWFCRRPRQ